MELGVYTHWTNALPTTSLHPSSDPSLHEAVKLTQDRMDQFRDGDLPTDVRPWVPPESTKTKDNTKQNKLPPKQQQNPTVIKTGLPM